MSMGRFAVCMALLVVAVDALVIFVLFGGFKL